MRPLPPLDNKLTFGLILLFNFCHNQKLVYILFCGNCSVREFCQIMEHFLNTNQRLHVSLVDKKFCRSIGIKSKNLFTVKTLRLNISESLLASS